MFLSKIRQKNTDYYRSQTKKLKNLPINTFAYKKTAPDMVPF